MEKRNLQDPNRPKRVAKTARETSDSLNQVHRGLIEEAQNARAAEIKLRDFADLIEGSSDFPELKGTESALNKYKKFVQARERNIEAQSFDFSAPVLSTAASTAVSSMITFGGNQNWDFVSGGEDWPPWWNRKTVNGYAKKLEMVRVGLGELLLAAWDSLYGTRHEPWRAVLANVRELFNQFFESERVAPDAKVRESQFFNPLREGKKNEIEVWRKERIQYAIQSKVKDAYISENLMSQVDLVLGSYDKLNLLHTRGEINQSIVKPAFVAILSFLKQFIDALTSQGEL